MKKMLLSLLAVILIIEEWLWDLLSALGHSLIRLLKLESVERWLSQTSPKTALIGLYASDFNRDAYQYRRHLVIFTRLISRGGFTRSMRKIARHLAGGEGLHPDQKSINDFSVDSRYLYYD